jgi:hypothetical protein
VRRVIGLLVAVLLGTATGGLVIAGPAAAAACSKGTGVTVVVGSSVGCDGNGGGNAASNFTGAGHSLTYVSNSTFVCKVDGGPSNATCTHTPPATAYWGLFWSNGTSGKWTYASSGVTSLTVPKGGWVAFVFQHSSSPAYPGVHPVAAAPAKPKPKPPTSTTPSGGGAGGKPSASATPTTSKSSKSGNSKSDKSKSEAKPSPSATPTDGATATTQPGDDLKNTSQETDGSSSLGWVAAALAVVLIAGMGTVVWRRRIAGGRTP